MKFQFERASTDTDGVWTDFSEGVRFRIARSGNPVFLRASDRLEAPHRNKRGLPSEKALEIQCRAMAQGILRGWEGVETPDGNPAPFDEELAHKLLLLNPDVREFVFEFATNLENFRKAAIEETAGK